ncbi:MAG: hypothetical protein ACRDTA_16245 [Pseudonocardiaceae bacterium]
MEYFLVLGVTAFAASGGWMVWGVQQALHSHKNARIQQEMLRERELTERQRIALQERQLADEVYRDFARRQAPGIPPPVDPDTLRDTRPD